jgi:hypothetical protein
MEISVFSLSLLYHKYTFKKTIDRYDATGGYVNEKADEITAFSFYE